MKLRIALASGHAMPRQAAGSVLPYRPDLRHQAGERRPACSANALSTGWCGQHLVRTHRTSTYRQALQARSLASDLSSWIMRTQPNQR